MSEHLLPDIPAGTFALCRSGVLGMIEGQAALPWGMAYVGYALATGKPWSSQDPRVFDPASTDMLRALLERVRQLDTLAPMTPALTLETASALSDALVHPDDDA